MASDSCGWLCTRSAPANGPAAGQDTTGQLRQSAGHSHCTAGRHERSHPSRRWQRDLQVDEGARVAGGLNLEGSQGVPRLEVPQFPRDHAGSPAGQPEPATALGDSSAGADAQGDKQLQCPGQGGRGGRVSPGEPQRDGVKQDIGDLPTQVLHFRSLPRVHQPGFGRDQQPQRRIQLASVTLGPSCGQQPLRPVLRVRGQQRSRSAATSSSGPAVACARCQARRSGSAAGQFLDAHLALVVHASHRTYSCTASIIRVNTLIVITPIGVDGGAARCTR
jgi:hypothetical protein